MKDKGLKLLLLMRETRPVLLAQIRKPDAGGLGESRHLHSSPISDMKTQDPSSLDQSKSLVNSMPTLLYTCNTNARPIPPHMNKASTSTLQVSHSTKRAPPVAN